MNKDGKLTLAVKCGCHCTYTNEILTMAIKKHLQNMVFLSNKNHPQSFYFNSSFPSAIGPLSRFTKRVSKFLNCNVSSALTRDEGIRRKTFGK